MTKIVYLLTESERKKSSFRKAIIWYDIDLQLQTIWLPEIQSEDTDEVAKFASKYGAEKLQLPVIKVDVWFFINALWWFPGPFVRYISDQVWTERFYEMLKNIDDRSAYLKTSVAYCEPGKEPVCFSSISKGEIVKDFVKWEWSLINSLFIPLHDKNINKLTLWDIKNTDFDLALEIWGDAEIQFAKWFSEM